MKKNKILIVLSLLIAITFVSVKKNLRIDIQNSHETFATLRYEEIKVGGGKIANLGKKITIHYVGMIAEGGKKFDSSIDRKQPFEFKLGSTPLIKGLDQGIVGMNVGGTRKIMIPAELGYGARGAGEVVPPNSDLIFEVELLKVE